ncbi:MAG: hypothetical protein LBP67_00285 [Bacteroidales bacterium]|jgi:hypothetical protein|nr:hypothetical protein [Bacteroidales bacterium]
MRKLSLLLFLTIFGVTLCYAQDVITKQNGEDIQAKVVEIGSNEVKYKKFDNQDGPIYSIPTSEILMIRYENGSNEVFSTKKEVVTTSTTIYPSHETPQGIRPNMLYKEYKDLYQPSMYIRHYTDPYNPPIMGLCSFFIPGLGQMICGEVGRGFAYLGGTIGCGIIAGIGSAMLVGYGSPGGLIMFIGGGLGATAVGICSIVDGVRVAKIKNMYARDLRDMSAFNIELAPYIDYMAVGNNIIVPVGVSMIVSF